MNERLCGLREYMERLRSLAYATPALQIESTPLLLQDVTGLKGRARKRYEDLLDALFCAYTGLYLWHYRHVPNRRHVFGDVDTGFITIPIVPAGEAH